MRSWSWSVGFPVAVLVSALVTSRTAGAPRAVKVPIKCSRGPSGQSLHVVVTQPSSQATGSRFTVRFDSVPSGTISHTGLNYIFDQATDYLLPPGARYVEGSARIVPDTGTTNVRAGARAWREGATLHVLLPAQIENGASYTPPSVEVELEVTAAAGATLPIKLEQYRVAANVFLLGDLRTTCDPEPAPYTLGTTLVASPPAH